MTDASHYDSVVVGAGPNGLAAAVELARGGQSVVVLEAADTIGGGTRSAELTLPGFIHDVCSAIHPLAMGSPYFRSLPLAEHGLRFAHPEAPLAHPFDDGTAAVLERSVQATAAQLGRDERAYLRLMGPLVRDVEQLLPPLLGPFRLPRHPLAMARFGLYAIRSASAVAASLFRDERARGLFAGMAGHSMLPLERRPSAAFGLVLGMLGHAVGWPVAVGGSQKIADALAGTLRSLGGEIVTARCVDSLVDLPPSRAVLFDLTPRQIARIAGDRLPTAYRRKLEGYRYGPGVCKVDWALDSPIPWTARDCARAATVHLGGTLAEVESAERAVWQGWVPERPFVILAQQSLFDPSRAPAGKHTAWAYCHMPNGSSADVSDTIEAQVERFAPGFRDRILARHTMTAVQFEHYNQNYVGGDINGGVQDFRQLFTRPVARWVPYSMPVRGLYICSSATPPGGGVHGMCGYFAARAALPSA